MKGDVTKWISECPTCQIGKHENVKIPGLLQPLAIPTTPWREIAMDFISGLPNSKGNDIIWVITDRYSRYTHFLPFSQPVTAKGLALIFFDNIFKLHGIPNSIVSDRDPLFLSDFWQTLFKISRTRLHTSTSYRP